MKNIKQRSAIFILFTLMAACGPKLPSDQDLTSDIQARLYGNSVTHSANVKVAVQGGVVTLSGDVPNSDVALQAMTVANGTAGIKSVNNEMKVVPAPSDSASTPAPADTATLAQSAPPPLPARQPATSLPPAPVEPPPPPPPAPVAVPNEHRSEHEEMMRHEAEREKERETAPPPKPPPITIPAGQAISIRMIDSIDTKHNQEGETFRASLSSPITDGDRVIVPVGTSATVLLAAARGAGRIKGQSELELRLTSLNYHGEPVQVSSSAYEAKGSARGKQTAIRTGLGAAAGALIGGLAGGGKGAGIGAAAGGGAGAGYQLLTHGSQIKIPSETEINFTLASPLVLNR
jgi:hypothetical protein